jgi:hypothetical protein
MAEVKPRYVPGDNARNRLGIPGFIELLAKARSITIEEAERQYNCDKAEELILNTGPTHYEGPDPGFQLAFEVHREPSLSEQNAMMPHELETDFLKTLLGKPLGKGTIIAEHGKLLPRPRPTTPEEDLQHLIEDTERKMTAPPPNRNGDVFPHPKSRTTMSEQVWNDIAQWLKEDVEP